jgi:hypothetical protein
MKKKAIILCLCLSLVATACAKESVSLSSSETIVSVSAGSSVETISVSESSVEEEYIADSTESVSAEDPEPIVCDSGNATIDDMVMSTVVLEPYEEIEKMDWVDEEKRAFRVWVQYKEEDEPDDEYRHIRDYFFFSDGVASSLMVDYPSWRDWKADRHPEAVCNFSAHFEDVTFDNHDDLLIFLGQAGNCGVNIYAAYIYENGQYVYNNSFEEIPEPEIDSDNKLIKGWVRDSAVAYVDFTYRYDEIQNCFTLILTETYEWSEEEQKHVKVSEEEYE